MLPLTYVPRAAASVSQSTFSQAADFNQTLNSWDVGKVTNLEVRGLALRLWLSDPLSRRRDACAASRASVAP